MTHKLFLLAGPTSKNERVWVQTNPERIDENERLRQLELMKRQQEDEKRKQIEDHGQRLYEEQRRRHEESRNQSSQAQRPPGNQLRPREDDQRTQQPDNGQPTVDPAKSRGQPGDRRVPWVGPRFRETTPAPQPSGDDR